MTAYFIWHFKITTVPGSEHQGRRQHLFSRVSVSHFSLGHQVGIRSVRQLKNTTGHGADSMKSVKGRGENGEGGKGEGERTR